MDSYAGRNFIHLFLFAAACLALKFLSVIITHFKISSIFCFFLEKGVFWIETVSKIFSEIAEIFHGKACP